MAPEIHRDSRLVLIVDDNPETLGMLIDALEESGLTALVARDGRSAISLLDRVTPDLILLDAIMPGADGFETCRLIKQRPACATVPIIFITGLSDSEYIVEGFQAGGVDYVTKPINPDELIARISIHIANARMISEAREALDTSGQGVVAATMDGEITWLSPKASEIIAKHWPKDTKNPFVTSQAVLDWLRDCETKTVTQVEDLVLASPEGQDIRFSIVGRSAKGDRLIRVAPLVQGTTAERFRDAFDLSLREAEVLSWLSLGKSNKDIAEILDLSPRTVTKHIEQIFTKLGVENRTAAAIVAIRYLDR